MKQLNMNIPKYDRKIIRKIIIFRIEILPKEAPPGVEKPPPLKKIEGGLAPLSTKGVQKSLVYT